MLSSLTLSFTPERPHRPSNTSGASSPKSVVWEANAEQELGGYGLPSLKKVTSDLKWLNKQRLTSKGSYNEKLGSFARELKDAKSEVHDLQEQLEAAMAQQATVQRAIDELKRDRVSEVERLEVQRTQTSDLKWLSKQRLTSKATYNEKLGSFSRELKDAKSEVHDLQEQLEAAMAQQATVRRAIDELKRDRVSEVERLEVQRMQKTVLQACAEDANLVPAILEGTEEHPKQQQQMLQRQYEDEELKAVRGPLEEICALLMDAKKAGRSKDTEDQSQASTLKQEAITKYVLLQRANYVQQ